MTDTDLHPRMVPAQKRAEETVKQILNTSAMLLDEVGLDGFNTNLLAERAGLRVGTIYRYFPNKLAILRALILEYANHMKTALETFNDLADPEKDWQHVICSSIDNYVAAAKKQKGFISIRRAMQAAPELRAIEKQLVRELSESIVEAIIKRGGRTSREQLLHVAGTFLMAAAATYDLAYLKGRKSQQTEAEIIAELKLMSLSYLANYLA